MTKIPMTENGLNSLQEHLKKLKNIDRPKVISDIKRAREYGDIKENAEYHAAKEEQFLIEKTIKNIENKILNANVIDITKINNNGQVIFGTTVELTKLDENKIMSYRIVGEDEADIKKKTISIQSPLARALILKSINDIVKINTPNGMLQYKIKNIKYI